MGINAVRKCNEWATYLFGGFSVLVLGHLVVETDWSKVFGQSAGRTSAMITGVGLIAVGGISWAPSAPDFTRYLPPSTPSAAIVRNTVGGAGVVVLPMVLMGLVMASATPDLASASDPVPFLGGLHRTDARFQGPAPLGGLGQRGDLPGPRQRPDARRDRLHGPLRHLPLAALGGPLGLARCLRRLRRLRRRHAAPHGVRRRGPPRHRPHQRLLVPGDFRPAAVTAWATGLGTGLLFTEAGGRRRGGPAEEPATMAI